MKRFILILLMFVTSMAWANSLSSDYAQQIEARVRAYLEQYLRPDDFMVYVNPRDGVKDSSSAAKASTSNSALPGVPGFDPSAANSPGGKGSWIDLEGAMHSQRAGVSVTVVFNKGLKSDKIRLFKKVLPQLARIDRGKGDVLTVTVGRLEREKEKKEEIPPPQLPPEKTFLDSMVEHRESLKPMVMLLFGGLAALVFLHGLFSFLGARQRGAALEGSSGGAEAGSDKGVSTDAPVGAKAVAEAGKPGASAERTGAFGAGAVDRNQLYSKDGALFELIRELMVEAKEHSDRIARLITEWIQEGDVGARSAAILLNNFDIPTAECVLKHVVPSDLDYIQKHLDMEFNPFSDENARVIYETRQRLMKITAQATRQAGPRSLAFLAELEDEFLHEVIRGEPPKTLAIVASQVPPHRMAQYIRGRSEGEQQAFFEAICRVETVTASEQNEMAEHFQAKIKEFQQMAFTDGSRTQTLASLLHHFKSASQQDMILKKLSTVSPVISNRVRQQLYFFEDILRLPERLMKLVLMEVDPVVVAQAVHDLGKDVRKLVLQNLSETAAEIFGFELNRKKPVTPEEAESARYTMVQTLERLVAERAIREEDVKMSRGPAKAAEAASEGPPKIRIAA